jgi:hypothetical protein
MCVSDRLVRRCLFAAAAAIVITTAAAHVSGPRVVTTRHQSAEVAPQAGTRVIAKFASPTRDRHDGTPRLFALGLVDALVVLGGGWCALRLPRATTKASVRRVRPFGRAPPRFQPT